MDITPFYELRARLRSAAIAGTGLIDEDFRLARSVEALEPLAKSSPVFGKIYQLSRQLTDRTVDAGEKGGLLLEALSLVDAVLCTQAVVGTRAELEPLPPALCQGSVVVNAPYSVVKRLQDALTTSGGGNYGYIMDTHRDSPELFRDYRVKGSLVAALGAGYSELAEQVTEWLKQDGFDLIGQLLDGFDPKGKKEMVRRVWVLDALCSADGLAGVEARRQVGGFLVNQLAEAEKDVRLAIIYALRNWPENVALLMELTRTERGKAKKAAHFALASLQPHDECTSTIYDACCVKDEAGASSAGHADDGNACGPDFSTEGHADGGNASGVDSGPADSLAEVRQFWRDYLAKKPEEALEYLALSNSSMAADLILSWQQETGCEMKQELLEQAIYINEDIRICQEALRRYEAATGDNGTAVPAGVSGSLGGAGNSEETVLRTMPAAVCAKILLEEDCTRWLQRQITKKNLLASRLDGARIEAMLSGISHLVWERGLNKYVLVQWVEGAFDCLPRTLRRPVAMKVDEDFYDLLGACGNKRVRGILWNLDKNRTY